MPLGFRRLARDRSPPPLCAINSFCLFSGSLYLPLGTMNRERLRGRGWRRDPLRATKIVNRLALAVVKTGLSTARVPRLLRTTRVTAYAIGRDKFSSFPPFWSSFSPPSRPPCRVFANSPLAARLRDKVGSRCERRTTSALESASPPPW